MGRRPYMNLLTLGRSPYEPPEPSSEDSSDHVVRPSLVNADGYSQEYDARGHPVNPHSKSLSKQLRKAKNDILSTMGIVVSGEDEAGSRREKEMTKLITDENDYGLALSTIDQVVMFMSPWWVTSLAARVQTFSGYSHLSPINIIRWERNHMGVFGFYFSGMPVWIGAFFISVWRNHFLGSALNFIYQKLSFLFSSERHKVILRKSLGVVQVSARAGLLLIAGQAYIFSLLQSLHVLSPMAVPAVSSFVPFAKNSLIQIPRPPTEISFFSIGKYALRLLTTPHLMIYFYVYLRPIIEGRLYRLLRRRLPKPDRPDKLSIRSAKANDLIEWTVPMMGRRSEEERARSELDFLDEIIFEFTLLKNWIQGLFKRERTRERARNRRGSWPERSQRHHDWAEQVQDDSNAREARGRSPGPQIVTPLSTPPIEEQRNWQHSQSILSSDPEHHSSNQAILPAEEQRMMQSPLQLPEEYFHPMADEVSAMGNRAAAPAPDYQASSRPVDDPHQQSSRSNTLFSRTSSPESSPLTSPRVRASLVHQNSDIITMQLELLQSRRNGNGPAQENTDHLDSSASAPPPIQRNTQGNNDGDTTIDEQQVAELLDALLSRDIDDDESHGQSSSEGTNVPPNRTIPQHIGSDRVPRQAEELTRTASDGAADTVVSGGHDARSVGRQTSNINGIRENQTDESSRVLPIPSNSRRTFLTDRLFPFHRVTILSAHPVDSLASHLASLITTVLFYPLESLYLRHLAHTFLSSTAVQSGAVPIGMAASTLGLQKYLRPVGAWFGGGGKVDMLSYVSKMILLTGIQAAVSASVWSLGTTTTVLLGRKKFGWGNL